MVDSLPSTNSSKSSPRSSETPRKPNASSATPSSMMRKAEQTPKTASEGDTFWVITLKLSQSIDAPMNALRQKYFPPGRTKQAGHISLFHAIPDSIREDVVLLLRDMAHEQSPFQVSTGYLFSMKKGVGVRMWKGGKQTKEIHDRIRGNFKHSLSDQDVQNLSPHWTIMNFENDHQKVEAVRQELEESGVEAQGRALGLQLWKYDPNGWVFDQDFTFSA